ncbi:3475_t:CDS:2 [Acaulospora colombiana]|uniref:3475_t:CDS:1 n=1 Tax=Acaulospora colombiana TaxID=27376 RepID=A0ACA9MC25_9GLOM|nr:3475_t:CDS:2 [Acaulospora colombiana]
MDKIKYVTCSANDISKLTNAQIQNIINQLTSKTISLGNDHSHVTSETISSEDNVTSKVEDLSESEVFGIYRHINAKEENGENSTGDDFSNNEANDMSVMYSDDDDSGYYYD